MSMSKTLIIAEKPSVAKDIAAALGVPRSGNVYENAEIVVSNCIGHLVEIHTPLADDRDAPLPIIPEKFDLRPIDRTVDQFKVVKKLMARTDISTVANACDAGREGEAIFRLTYELAGCRKPVERLWLQSMTAGAIRDAWQSRKPGSHYDDLGAASRCRAESDWLVGINGSRACRNAVGRVMTPTLALVVRRFLENKNFVTKDYFEVHGTFGAAAGDYTGKWYADAGDGDEDSRYRIIDRAKADALRQKCDGVAPSSVSDASKPTRAAPPLLFDLTSLQREANKAFKFSAAQTLEIAQALYEKAKVLTYPRTDSTALPEDYAETARATVDKLSAIPVFAPHACRILDGSMIQVKNKRVFNNAKISDHFAIVPTGIIPSGLSADEQAIYDLVARRFLASFHPDAEFLSTVRLTVVAGETFRSTGRVLVNPGWLEVIQGAEADDKAAPPLAQVREGEAVANRRIEVKALKTKPPALYSEATLLTAMETAGKALDEEMAEAMKERGLGTPATRAATIEKLLSAGRKDKPVTPFVVREKNSLVPTQRGIDLISYLDARAPKLTSPILTGEWEHQLRQMEHGKVRREDFMSGIEDFTREIVASVQSAAPPSVSMASGKGFDTACPKCGGDLVIDAKVVKCGKCDFRLWRIVAGKSLSETDIKTLLKKGSTKRLDGFTSKAGKPFGAALKMRADFSGVDFQFDS
jgi:DNA topoisomerase-3